MEGFSSFSQHFQLEVEILKNNHKTIGETQTTSLEYWIWVLEPPWIFICNLFPYCEFYPALLWELSSGCSNLKLDGLKWPILCVLYTWGAAECLDGESGDLGCSCWFILPMASAVCAQGSVPCPRHGIISFVFPEWSTGWVWQQNQSLGIS